MLSTASCVYMVHVGASFHITIKRALIALVTSLHCVATLTHARNTSIAVVLVIATSERV